MPDPQFRQSQVYPPPQDLHQSLQARLSGAADPLAQQGSGAFGEPPDSSGGARSGGGDSGGRSGNDELTEVRAPCGLRCRRSHSACSR